MCPVLKISSICVLSLLLFASVSTAQEATEPAKAAVSADSTSEATQNASSLSPSLESQGTDQSVETSSQAEVDRPSNTPAWQSPALARLAAPDVYLLPDETGKLRKVLGFRYEDFLKAWRRDAGQQQVAPPRYVLQQWKLSGEADESQARLKIQIDLNIQATGWVDVPIQLPELIVEEISIEGQRPGECVVFDERRHGYVLWLNCQQPQVRKLSLEGIAKLTSAGSSPALKLHLPRAVASDFSLIVPGDASQLETSPELTLRTVARDDGKTEVRLRGQTNPLRLSWSTDSQETTDNGAPVEVEEETVIKVDRRLATYETTLRVNSFGRPLQQIRVRLPRRAKLKLNQPTERYEVRLLPSTTDEDQRQEVEIRLLQPTDEPWSVQLAAERTIESFGNSAECRLGGFEVLTAFQQAGTVALEVDNQLQAYFDLHGEIEQVPLVSTAATATGRSVIGRFRYSRFPWQLVVFTSPRQRRVSVEPSYRLAIDADEARLDIEFDYRFTGAKVFSLRVNLQGWQLTDEPIDSGGAIDPNGIVETRDGRLVLRLVDSGMTQLSLKLPLRKKVQLGTNSFYLPEPLDCSVMDGELVVQASESLQLTPQPDEMIGLSPVLANDAGEVVSGTQELVTNETRWRTFLPQASFVAEIAERELEITAAQQTEVEIDQQTTRVVQEIDFQAKYKPVSQLTLRLPEQLWQNDTLQLTFNGEELPYGLSTETDDATVTDQPPNEQSATRRITVSLPRPMQNEIQLKLDYELPTPELAADELTAMLLPLASADAPVTQHEVAIRSTAPVSTSLNQRSEADAWQVQPRKPSSQQTASPLELRTTEKPLFLSLYAQREIVDAVQLATLERAWIQSWIAIGQRQERSVFRFHTMHAKAFVQLPPALVDVEIELLLDGKPIAYEMLEGNRLAVSLAAAGARQSHTLELRYQTPANLRSWSTLVSMVPQLECRIASAPIYWQLILPKGWQVTNSPEQLLPDYWLGWRHYRWGRQPTLTQADLEQITGAVSAAAPPPLATKYVYRAFQFPTAIQVTVVRQAWLFVVCALAVFGLGLLCLYTPIAQYGAFWLAIALGLLVGVLSYPEITLLATELLLVGGAMVLVAHILKRVFTERERSQSAPAVVPAEASEVTEPWQQPLDVSHAISETTATLKTGGPT